MHVGCTATAGKLHAELRPANINHRLIACQVLGYRPTIFVIAGWKLQVRDTSPPRPRSGYPIDTMLIALNHLINPNFLSQRIEMLEHKDRSLPIATAVDDDPHGGVTITRKFVFGGTAGSGCMRSGRITRITSCKSSRIRTSLRACLIARSSIGV